ncbi:MULTISPECIES: TetR/AcrR family transcriptional regulator [unclassified Streptomyces]|uniref:TetR/AcrR family transcriptional regulator n=1 Tax=unclassified Streptomyces TaxID=2593676 RepID=UPI000F6E6F77|nr:MULTISPECIES: TetR/AcrR family transcriptional regulator [unclassified Streptomyces]AZM58699.1 TetR family transcriptional regulator [Streptomyces sp. WAC 01438]RSM89995.1 TetR family transcriptional regulator [Streptomyces sp. WAC 01420]
MARWDPGAMERLRKAALDLFGEHGYDAVTVTQIAERAGLTRRTFHRYFPDKREILFAGSDRLPPAVAEAVLAVDPGLAPLRAALSALRAVGTEMSAHLTDSGRRRAIIDSSAELQERERSKSAAVTAALRDALDRRGAGRTEADLAARVASIVAEEAFRRWSDGERPFSECFDDAEAALHAVLTGDA